MKYRGRIILLFLSILTSFIYLVLGDDAVSPFVIFLSILHAAVSWVLGGWYDKIKYVSFLDPLTGVYNRRYANNTFEKKLKRAMKRDEPIGIITIDINEFKLLNDTYGHDYGDFVLKELSHLVSESIHKEDIFVRWGGDEFVLLLVNRDRVTAELFTEQLKETIRTSFSKQQEKKDIYISLSVGFAMFPEDATKLQKLITIADERMYEDKREMKLKNTP